MAWLWAEREGGCGRMDRGIATWGPGGPGRPRTDQAAACVRRLFSQRGLRPEVVAAREGTFCLMAAVMYGTGLRLMECGHQPEAGQPSPNSFATPCMAVITCVMCSSSGRPRSSAPRSMSSRFTAAAKDFCFIFLRTLLAAMPARRSGRT